MRAIVSEYRDRNPKMLRRRSTTRRKREQEVSCRHPYHREVPDRMTRHRMGHIRPVQARDRRTIGLRGRRFEGLVWGQIRYVDMTLMELIDGFFVPHPKSSLDAPQRRRSRFRGEFEAVGFESPDIAPRVGVTLRH